MILNQSARRNIHVQMTSPYPVGYVTFYGLTEYEINTNTHEYYGTHILGINL
jgi:hypothetical protein